MIILTGAAGFIGSVVAGELNQKGYNDLILVDDFSKKEKERNYIDLKYEALVDRNIFFDWFKENHEDVDFVVHLGARTDTTEFDWNVFLKLNVDYTQTMFSLCAEYHIPMVYASSAATYGNGELGYDDSHEVVEKFVGLDEEMGDEMTDEEIEHYNYELDRYFSSASQTESGSCFVMDKGKIPDVFMKIFKETDWWKPSMSNVKEWAMDYYNHYYQGLTFYGCPKGLDSVVKKILINFLKHSEQVKKYLNSYKELKLIITILLRAFRLKN